MTNNTQRDQPGCTGPRAHFRRAGCMLVALTLFASVSCRKKEQPSRGAEAEPAVVQTAPAVVRPMQRVLAVSGSFHAREQSTLSVKVPGRLARLAVDMGSTVRKGAELAQIDRADYELRVQQAEAVLAQARALVGLPLDGTNDTVEIEETATIRQARALLEEAARNRDRIKQLTTDRIAPQSELDTVEAAHAVAVTRYQDALETIRSRVATVVQRRAELNLARKQLADTVTTAPFDGIVHQRLASVGEFLQSGIPLLVMANVNPLRLRLEIPEREATHVRTGQVVRIMVGNDTNVYAAQLTRVSPMLQAGNRMLLVEADVPCTPPLRPGLFARAEIAVEENDPALSVPEAAIATFVGIDKVFLVQDGKVIERNIVAGRRRNGFVEVTSGLGPGDKVVLKPGRLRTGQPVIEEANAASR